MSWLDGISTAWRGHEGFARWLVRTTRPSVVVDLGVDRGFSTFSFAAEGCGTVYGVDWFQGDAHAGIRDTYAEVVALAREHRIDNVRFIKGEFGEVARLWDTPIDILHIDGFHTYDAVARDIEAWSRFVKPDGIMLFHDVCVPNFGVQRAFAELPHRKAYFEHSFGLGIATHDERKMAAIVAAFPNVKVVP